MAGGYWEKGQNPYWNYDSDAAFADKQRINAELDTFRTKLEMQKAKDREEFSRRQATLALNTAVNTQVSLTKKIEDLKLAFFRLAMKSNIFQNTLEELIVKHPEMIDEILDLMQLHRDKCNNEEYRKEWWGWISNSELNHEHNYLKFPFEKRELKKD
ncbi:MULTISPECIES: hypothetical protein [Pantoea]|uniref:hypothetical protein n=1 Tax=Pantoea TaxID=53335 RepID=UPI001F1CCB55|nr:MULTISPECIES: hypothetical protein [Pantoea]MEB6225416.1 hypothetical protein [Pantoea anthophila]UIL55087.1 hypothetical protein LZU96_23280 [Pantoea agglomerans]